MNFFGVGPFELALVAIIAVIVLGPERIPTVAVQLARAVRYMRGYASDATADIRKELEELTKEYDEVRKELQGFRQSIQKDVTSVVDQVSSTIKEVEPIIEPGGDPPPSNKPRSPDGKGS